MVAQANNLVRDFRKAIKTSVGSGWTVENDKVNIVSKVVCHD
jgi:hypothetical protein